MRRHDSDKKGVALKYAMTDYAPSVIAKARGKLLDAMLKIAEERNIAVFHDADLAEVLYALDTGSEIPPELYASVAEVIAYCYRLNKSMG